MSQAITITFPALPSDWTGDNTDLLNWVRSNIEFNIPDDFKVDSNGTGTSIALDFPAMPEGFSATPDIFLQWMADNAIITVAGAFLNGQIGGTIDSSRNSGLWIDTAGRTLEAWDNTQGKYVTVGGPVGGLIPFAGINLSNAPKNYLFCEGQTLERDQYPELFAVLGTAYGNSTDYDFNLPDLRGRGIIGCDGISPDSAGYTTGDARISGFTGRLPSHAAGAYEGTQWLNNIPFASGAPGTGTLVSGITTVSLTSTPPATTLTVAAPPTLALRWLIRYR